MTTDQAIVWSSAAVLVAIASVAIKASTSRPPTPRLVNTCLVTKDVARLTGFYGNVLRIAPKKSGPEYTEFQTGVGVLAIFSDEAQEKYIPHSAQPAQNKSAILEFQVSDVDREYARLQNVVHDWVKPPTTQPWGTRSTYFRDPDGNLIDFYAWMKNAEGKR